MQRKLTLQAQSLKSDVTEFLGIGRLDPSALRRNGTSRNKFDYTEEIRKGTVVHTSLLNCERHYLYLDSDPVLISTVWTTTPRPGKDKPRVQRTQLKPNIEI